VLEGDVNYYLKYEGNSIMKRLLLILIIAFSIPASVGATTWYVAKTGSDSNSCSQAQNSSTPKLTIAAGLSCIGTAAGAGAGHTVLVGNGTYAETFSSMPSGISGNFFTLKSQNPLGAVIKPNTTSSQIMYFGSGINQYMLIDGFGFDGSNVSANNIYIALGTNDITIQNIELKNVRVGDGTGPGSFQGMYSEGDRIKLLNSSIHDIGNGASQHFNHAVYWPGSNGLIEGNTIYNVGGYGIQLYSGHTYVPNSNVIRKNKVFDFSRAGVASGILMSSGTGNVAYNNIVYQTSANGNAVGISVGSGNSAYNNTVYNNGYMGIDVLNQSNTVIRNNIAYNNGVNIDTSGSSGLISSNNLTTDPKFVNAAGFDFSLQSTSAAINAGVTVAMVLDDLAGVTRPQGSAYDIGAYEYVSGGGTLVPPSNLLVSP
jgi:parallel beta-helix repeat protein